MFRRALFVEPAREESLSGAKFLFYEGAVAENPRQIAVLPQNPQKGFTIQHKLTIIYTNIIYIYICIIRISP